MSINREAEELGATHPGFESVWPHQVGVTLT